VLDLRFGLDDLLTSGGTEAVPIWADVPVLLMGAKKATTDGVNRSLSTKGSQSRWRPAAQRAFRRRRGNRVRLACRICLVRESLPFYCQQWLESVLPTIHGRGLTT
jgi:hypothetical protein